MAKHCDVCNRWFADQFESCPDCAAAKAGAPGRVSDSMLHVELAGNLPISRVPPSSGSDIELHLEQDAKATNTRPPSGSEVNLGERGRATHNVMPPGSESQIEIVVPVVRVPDTNSGVPIDLAESTPPGSRIRWASLTHDASQRETSGLRIDSPSDADLIIAAQAEADSASRISEPAMHQEPSVEVSAVRILPRSEPDLPIDDSSSGFHVEPSVPTTGPSSIIRTDELNTRTSASHVSHIGGPADAETSAVNLGEPVNDARAGGNCSGQGQGSGSLRDQPVRVSADPEVGRDSASSILPEPDRRSDDRRTPPRGQARATQNARGLDEHFSSADESAVDLGGTAGRPSGAGEELSASAGVASGAGQLDSKANANREDPCGVPSLPRSSADRWPTLLAGAGAGLVFGLAISAGLMFAAPDKLAKFGIQIGNPRAETSSNGPGTGQQAALDAAGADWAARFAGQSPEEIANRLEQLAREKNEAEKKAMQLSGVTKAAEKPANDDLAEKLKVAETRSSELADLLKAAEKKTAELALKLKEDEDKAAALSTAMRAAQESQAQADRRAEEAEAAAEQARDLAAKAESARREAIEAGNRIKDVADSHRRERVEDARQPESSAVTPRHVETAIQPDGRSAPAAGKESQAGSPESSFATGLQLYWAGSYARAEDWFADAVHRDGRDARFYYFLGLARWSQGRLTEARRDFERASALEKQDSPSRAAVNAVLERVQGGMRRELDYYRK